MKHLYIAKGGVLLGAEGTSYIQATQQGVVVEAVEAAPK